MSICRKKGKRGTFFKLTLIDHENKKRVYEFNVYLGDWNSMDSGKLSRSYAKNVIKDLGFETEKDDYIFIQELECVIMNCIKIADAFNH